MYLSPQFWRNKMNNMMELCEPNWLPFALMLGAIYLGLLWYACHET